MDKNNQLNKKFTIILPAFNEEKTIVKTVEAALGTGASEILVIDDGSIDNTVFLLAPFLKSHPQLKVISHPKNQGCGAARKTGILAASNPIFMFFDSDIENISSEMMTRLISPVLRNEADFVMASFENFGRITEYL
ncbi:MAG TPA: glycosyltransferase family 2 protein, partial [Candidatus Paceibacterota bacterium]|nr:glycosyltransferase family 2 protein [Candidatus Paceibacterota bacterium]